MAAAGVVDGTTCCGATLAAFAYKTGGGEAVLGRAGAETGTDGGDRRSDIRTPVASAAASRDRLGP